MFTVRARRSWRTGATGSVKVLRRKTRKPCSPFSPLYELWPMRKPIISALVLTGLVALVLAFFFWPRPGRQIQFASYGKSYDAKPDLASVERQFPMQRSDRERLMPHDLKAINQEQLDQLYARLTAGTIPDGLFDGALLQPEGAPLDRIADAVGGLKGLALKFKRRNLGILVNVLWHGKVFERNERVARNRIEDLTVLRPLVGGDWKEAPQATVGGRNAWLLFPAKVYCGQGLLDGRRESIVVDYAFADEIVGYHETPDFLASRQGFSVRDELRMIRPGFYLGRAYLSRIFALNFTLYNDAIARREVKTFARGGVQEDCWVGTQQPGV